MSDQILSEEYLGKLKTLADAATPGPWRRCAASDGTCTCGLVWSIPADTIVIVGHDRVKDDLEEGVSPEQRRANEAFAAEAREAVPALIAQNEWLRKQLREQMEKADRVELALEHSREDRRDPLKKMLRKVACPDCGGSGVRYGWDKLFFTCPTCERSGTITRQGNL